MELITCGDSDLVAAEIVKKLKALALRGKRLRCFFPTGSSPKKLYALIRSEKSFWSKHLEIYQIDDYFGDSVAGAFRREIESEIIHPLGIEEYFHPVPVSEKEFQQHCTTVMNTQFDLALLGLGPNGHVGFHEPHLPGDFSCGSVKLGDETKEHLLNYNKRVGEKIFSVDETITARTFGAAAFKKADNIFVIVTGENKSAILQRLLTSPANPKLPGSLLKAHPRLFIFADRAAASKTDK